MNNRPPHATVFDLPGWPTPPSVSAILDHPGSWGHIPVEKALPPHPVCYDDQGRLWVNGDEKPSFQAPAENSGSPGAIVFWVEIEGEPGIGLWIHPKSLKHLKPLDKADADIQWLPVNKVAREMPPFVKDTV